MRYGRLNADGGPEGRLVESRSAGLGEPAVKLGDGEGALVSGGGSMVELEEGILDGSAGSGSAGISSSADVVSIVICLVVRTGWRSV
jgi:hypothetical protein